MTLSLGFSPCPNDTFVFHAWVHGRVPGPDVTVTLADIDDLNSRATTGQLDVVKVSYGALPWLLDDYALLSSGGAVGRGCGPLVLASDPISPASLRGARIAVPGERTTAYLLLRLWDPGFSEIEVLPYDEIMPAVESGEVDAGLVIHESRFTYPAYGLHAVTDLGEWWERETGLPIPLGAIVARRALGQPTVAQVDAVIRASVEAAWADPAASRDYVREHGQELDPAVADAHIALYVNEFTRDLGDEGRAAVDALLTRAADRGLVPRVQVSR
ncbi:MAG: 1,4-dihydroxy-6-naphthoate synthase [Mycobacteriales bacterium]|nr:1,4-dihydroxy-6-naphthoate synthase [Frankia sp.]